MKNQIQACLLVALLGLFPTTLQAAQVEETPGAFTMAGDLLVARPIGMVLVALGTATYVVTLPFSIAGGNAKDAGDMLVVQPVRETFVRCLGCRRIGRKEKIRE